MDEKMLTLTRRRLLAAGGGAVAGTYVLGTARWAPPAAADPLTIDPRKYDAGHLSIIPDESYSDMPWVVVANNGDWVCTMTTGAGGEGSTSQHIVAVISEDQGLTWGSPIDIEPDGPPEASWAMPFKVPSSGRIYVIYWYNVDALSLARNDVVGDLFFKYSDDHGQTWSGSRYLIPTRITDIDLLGGDGGDPHFGWCVGKPIVVGTDVYFGSTKLKDTGFTQTESFFWKSPNLLTQSNPALITWEMLPLGDDGVQATSGLVCEENNLVALSTGTLYSVYRTVNGYLGVATSSDGGDTWTSADAHYTPGGRKIKNPRGPAIIRKLSNGKYLLWYYNNSTTSFENRNPVWLCGGWESGGTIVWSQPEILLYATSTTTRIGYNDFVEDGGDVYVTETDKSVARVHLVDPALLAGLWGQQTADDVTTAKLGAWIRASDYTSGQSVPAHTGTSVSAVLGNSTGTTTYDPAFVSGAPSHFSFSAAGSGTMLTLDGSLSALQIGSFIGTGLQGFSLELWIRFDDITANRTILDTRNASNRGIILKVAASGALQLWLNDGTTTQAYDSDAGVVGTSGWHHVVVTADGSADIVTFVIDGQLNDGGTARTFGWSRISAALGNVNSGSTWYLGHQTLAVGTTLTPLNGDIAELRVYTSFLTTSEAVSNWRAGPPS